MNNPEVIKGAETESSKGEVGRKVNRVVIDEAEPVERLREEFSSLEEKPFELEKLMKEEKYAADYWRTARKLAVAIVTEDARKLAVKGDYDVSEGDLDEVRMWLDDLDEDAAYREGRKVIRKIATPIKTEGVEAVYDKIVGRKGENADNKVLEQLYSFTEEWKTKDKIKVDKGEEYTDKDKREMGIDALKELVATYPTAVDFCRHCNFLVQGEESKEQVEAFRKKAEKLGRIVYGNQYRYAKVYTEAFLEGKMEVENPAPGEEVEEVEAERAERTERAERPEKPRRVESEAKPESKAEPKAEPEVEPKAEPEKPKESEKLSLFEDYASSRFGRMNTEVKFGEELGDIELGPRYLSVDGRFALSEPFIYSDRSDSKVQSAIIYQLKDSAFAPLLLFKQGNVFAIEAGVRTTKDNKIEFAQKYAVSDKKDKDAIEQLFEQRTARKMTPERWNDFVKTLRKIYKY